MFFFLCLSRAKHSGLFPRSKHRVASFLNRLWVNLIGQRSHDFVHIEYTRGHKSLCVCVCVCVGCVCGVCVWWEISRIKCIIFEVTLCKQGQHNKAIKTLFAN